MKISDLLTLSFENLRRRMGRTTLTVIGVVVGTCSIVVMMSLGIAMNVGFDEMMQQWGDLTQIQVYTWGSTNSNGDKIEPITDAVVKEFQNIENVITATPIYQSQYMPIQMVSGKNNRYVSNGVMIVGMYPEAIELLQYNLESGSYLPEVAPSLTGSGKKKIHVLVGLNTAYGFMDTKKKGNNSMVWSGQTDANGNPVKPFVDINQDTINIITGGGQTDVKSTEYQLIVHGVMQEDYAKGYVTSQGVIMDLNILKSIESTYMKANGIKASSDTGYSDVVVKVNDVDNVEAVEKVIKDYGYTTYSMTSQRESMQKQAQTMQMVLGGLGAVSLFVAALSIANTMTMAIYERTREIGVMKVLGCELSKIRFMFLLEAGFIGFIGGVLGVIVSYALSTVLNIAGPALSAVISIIPMYGSKISIIPAWLALVGIAFATLIGILSGIMPADRAVKISALEAIRHE